MAFQVGARLMARRKREDLQITIVHTQVPDAAARIARAFDVILENAARRRAEMEGAPLEAADDRRRGGMANA